jgi:flagellar protein FlaG
MGSMGTSEMIFFIATLVVSIAVVGVLGGQTSHIALSMENSAQNTQSQIENNFVVINDPSFIPHANGTYTFYIKNTGSDGFYFTNNSVTVMINGSVISPSIVGFATPDNTGELEPGQVGDIYVTVPIGNGFNTLTVVLDSGLSKTFTFQIGGNQ